MKPGGKNFHVNMHSPWLWVLSAWLVSNNLNYGNLYLFTTVDYHEKYQTVTPPWLQKVVKRKEGILLTESETEILHQLLLILLFTVWVTLIGLQVRRNWIPSSRMSVLFIGPFHTFKEQRSLYISSDM